MCPASWNARIRCRGIARPMWMSGEVTSMPSLTRNGRPSASFFSSPPCGSRSTWLRARVSMSLTAPVILRAPSRTRAERRCRRSATSPAKPASAETPPAITSVPRAPSAATSAPPAASAIELGRVAEPVVGGERATVAVRRDALVDERAEGDVLDAVAGTADEVADDHEPEDEPERRERLPEPLDGDGGASRATASAAAGIRGERKLAASSIPTVQLVRTIADADSPRRRARPGRRRGRPGSTPT